MRVEYSRGRRGVLLILVMALLAFFSLAAVAYVVLSNQALRGAKADNRRDQFLKTPEEDVVRGAMLVIRGPLLGRHCLLEDMHGDAGPDNAADAANPDSNDLPFSGSGFTGDWALRPFSASLGGSADEDYDAVDFNNMLLAMVISNPDDPDGKSSIVPIPSLLRPSLVRYWKEQQGASSWTELPEDVLREIVPRPLVTADLNSTFTGSNPNFSPEWDGVSAGFSWDVDNDGDGVADSIWVDPGMPERITADGRRYKPLYAILCIDMDGRLNLNAHGSPRQAEDGYYSAVTIGGQSLQLHRGQGYGPAEINLRPVLGSQYSAVLQGASDVDGRYGEGGGSNSGPGQSNFDDWHSRNCTFEYSGNYWGFQGGGSYQPDSYGSPPDFHGTGSVALDALGRPLFRTPDTGNEDDPYEINLSRDDAHGLPSPAPIDNPFGPAELERVLRPFDRDSVGLPRRLVDLLSESVQVRRRFEVTTESWDLPLSNPRAAGLELPDEFAYRLNLNYPFGNGKDDDENGVVDEPGEPGGETMQLYNRPSNTVDATIPDGQQLREEYAGRLVELLDKLAGLDSETANQWAANVIDFRDRDSIMTRIGDTWGCEWPQLLITEVLAFHDRRTEDLDTDAEGEDKKTDAEESPDDNYDQHYLPQGSLFVELYNPWTVNQPAAREFCDSYSGAVDLAKLSSEGSSPVWRLIVVDPAEGSDPDDPGASVTVERAVYFVDSDNIPWDAELNYFATGAPTKGIAPGGYAVIGPGMSETSPSHRKTYIGLEPGQEDPADRGSTRHIDMSGGAYVVRNNEEQDGVDRPTGIDSPALVVVDSAKQNQGDSGANKVQRLSISEPLAGYDREVETTNQDGDAVTVQYDDTTEKYDQPLDQPRDDAAGLSDLLGSDRVIPAHRLIHLQRLANPLKAYNENENPYRTIDSMAVDLTVFNGVANDGQKPEDFQSRQRGEQNGPAGAMLLWKQEPEQKTFQQNNSSLTAPHYFGTPLTHSLGYLNRAYGQSQDGSSYQKDPLGPFPWLTWSNRPFASPMELLLVPVYRSSRLLAFDPSQQHSYYDLPRTPENLTNPYSGAAENVPFPHLPNFFDPNRRFYRLLDYVHVPSRYVSASKQGNATESTSPFYPGFKRRSRFRDPGRINLNTIFSADVYQGLMNYFPQMDRNAVPWRWAEFVKSRRGYSVENETSADMLATDPAFPTRFARPFRSFAGGTPVPGMTLAREIDATLLRSDAVDVNETSPPEDLRPLFSFDTATALSGIGNHNDPDRNPYFRYQALQRLANLVTTRSNVYAIWITVGYFELTPDGLGPELGTDTGEIERHRGFFLFDRSIPVGFERGKDLDVEQALLIRRFIE